MRLEGSCQCEKVTFRVESATPYPFMNCYCSICRKLSGGAYGTNIMGKRATLKVRGEKYIREYHAPLPVPPARARVHIMTKFKPAWVPIAGPGKTYPRYPELSIQKWHETHGLLLGDAKRPPGTKRAPAKRA